MEVLESKLEKQIVSVKEKINRCNQQLLSWQEKLRSNEAELARLELIQESQTLRAVNSVFTVRGLTLQEVVAAVEKGKLNELQEKMDGIKEKDKNPQGEAQQEKDNAKESNSPEKEGGQK
jgi:predicted DNA-binding protein YlxM (UPF0122 family)